MRKILFLPGAGGSPEFWQPVAKLLPDQRDKVFFGWPGLGDQPHDPRSTASKTSFGLSRSRLMVRSIWWGNPWAASSRRA